jgi:hypothetical protein
LFIEQLRYPKVLSEEIAHYDRHDRGTPEHSYKFVRKQLKANLDRNRKRANRSALKKALGGKGSKVPAAPGTKGKGKGQRERRWKR